MNKKHFFIYVKTFFSTLFIIFLIIIGLLFVVQHKVNEQENLKPEKEAAIDYYLIGVLIEKNKYMEQKFPKDYRVNLRLGVLYEIQKNLNESENQYKIAILKEPFGEYKAQHKLALLYLKMNRTDEAENLIDAIAERPDKNLISYKADFFNRLGDKYYNQGDYENASDSYRKSMQYYKIIHAKQHVKTVSNNLASAYVYLADVKIQNMQIDDAIQFLENAYQIVDAPIIRYKLALLLSESNPGLAYEYYEDVFKREPEIINYDEYFNFLSRISENAQLIGDTASAELYRFKIKKIKEYCKRNILSVEDLKVENADGTVKFDRWAKKYNINLDFTIKNVSKYNINPLYIEVIFKDGADIIDDQTQQIVDDQNPLKPNGSGLTINVKSQKEKINKSEDNKKIQVEIYALKSPETYKLLLKEMTLEEKPKAKKSDNKSENWFAKLFHLELPLKLDFPWG